MPLSWEWQRRIDGWKNGFRSLFGGGSGGNQPRPQICPACGALVGINATKCYQCGTNLRFSAAALGKKFAGVFGDNPAPVTTVLLIANVLMLGVSLMAVIASGGGNGLSILWGLSGTPQYRLGCSVPMAFLVENNEWWRLVTAMFLHGGLIHIGFNMTALMQLGPALEELYGSGRYLFLYTLTGAFGFLASSFFSRHLSLGASGAILGLVGAMLAVTSKRGGAYMKELRSRLISSVVMLFVLGLMPGIAIDNWAHGGGLLAGFLLGKMFVDRQPMNASERRNSFLLGAFAALVILGCFALMILHYRDPLPGAG